MKKFLDNPHSRNSRNENRFPFLAAWITGVFTNCISKHKTVGYNNGPRLYITESLRAPQVENDTARTQSLVGLLVNRKDEVLSSQKTAYP